MSNHRTRRPQRRQMSLATESVRADQARTLAQKTLATAGALNLLDLYGFAQDAVHHMVIVACPAATELRQHIVERVLDRIASRLRRRGANGVQFATVPAMESYLKRTIRTNLIDARRAARLRAEAAPLVDQSGTVTPMVDVVADPHARVPGADMIDPVHHRLLARVILQGLNALSSDARQALRLMLEGRSAPQIGEIMGRTPESVRQLLSRGIRSLRTMVTNELEAAGIPLTDIGLAHLQRLAQLTTAHLAR